MPNVIDQFPETPQTPATPQAAQAPAAPLKGVPSLEQYRILKARQSELTDQREAINDRRQELVQEIQGEGNGTLRSGLEGQLQVVDKRLIQIETDLADVGREVVAAAPASLTNPPERVIYRGYGDEDMVGAGFSGAAIMLALLLPFLIRSFRRRKFVSPTAIKGQPTLGAERMDRMEQAIDTIAVEIERVSENQRFMTRLITETQLANSIAAVRGSTEVAKAAAEVSGNG